VVDTDLNDLPAWVVQRMKDKDAEIDRLRAQVKALRTENRQLLEKHGEAMRQLDSQTGLFEWSNEAVNDLEWLWANCEITYWPRSGSHPFMYPLSYRPGVDDKTKCHQEMVREWIEQCRNAERAALRGGKGCIQR
jgi:hypothetical protein